MSGTDLQAVSTRTAEILHEFCGLLQIPTTAADTEGLRRCATHIKGMLGRRGLDVRLVEQEGAAPLVVGMLDVGADKTLALYSHYDGQPVGQTDWINDPWQPTLHAGVAESGAPRVEIKDVKDWSEADYRLYARCASDDKAPTQALCSALDLLGNETPACNLLVITEGEEESGSTNFLDLLKQVPEAEQVDAWLILDGPIHPSRKQQVIFGARGVVTLQITAYGPTKTLHSGHFGNWVPNPAMRLVHLLASMRNEKGHVTVEGFNDHVLELTETEQNTIAQMPETDEQLLKEFGVHCPEDGTSGMSEATMRPAINLHGIAAGHVQSEATNAIMTEAHASMDIRLVPNQTVAEVKQAVERHIINQGYSTDEEQIAEHDKTVKLDWGEGYEPARTPLDTPFAKALVQAATEGAGEQVVVNPMLGGSVPIRKIVATADKPVAILPIANHDNNQHGANENIRVHDLMRGIAVYAAVLRNLRVLD